MKRSLFVVAALLIAVPVVAQMGIGPFPIGPGAMFTVPGAFDLPVANDGTVFVERNVPGGGVELAAIRPSGAVAWTFRLQMPLIAIAINDTTVMIAWRTATGVPPAAMSTKTHLTALSLASGSVMGTIDYDGDVPKIAAFHDGFYARRLIPDGAGPRPNSVLLIQKLVALDNTAKELWSLAL